MQTATLIAVAVCDMCRVITSAAAMLIGVGALPPPPPRTAHRVLNRDTNCELRFVSICFDFFDCLDKHH